MDIHECTVLLHHHAELRMPVFTMANKGEFANAMSPAKKIEALEDYLGTVAVARGNLEEARLWADHVRHSLETDWDALDGWQALLPVKHQKAPTGPQIVQAKRGVRPDIYDALREAKWVVARLTDQIKRLERDEDTASRRYTLLTGS